MGVLLLPLLLVLADQPESVAMVLKIKGEVTLTRGEGKPVRVWSMDLLLPGDRLSVPEGGEVSLFVLDDGHKEVLAAGKTATLGAKGCSPAEAVARKEEPRLNKSNLKNLRDDIRGGRFGGVILRAPNGQPQPVLTPLPGANLLTDRPTLSWPAVGGVDYYAVQLFTGPDNKDLFRLWRIETKENRLPFPTDKPALAPVLHRWSVTARLKNGEDKELVTVRQATFSVATPREIKALEAASPLAAGDDPAELLLAAGLYESRLVLDESLKIFERLAKLQPGDARIQETLAGYYQLGGRHDLAKVARDKAQQLRQAAGGK